MGCMKCGRDVSSGQVFCDICLEEMERYPVKPGTVVRLPQRREKPAARKVNPRRKNQSSPEEQVKALKKAVIRLVSAVILLTLLLGVTGYFTVIHFMEGQTMRPGQNYSSAASSEPTETTETTEPGETTEAE